jgi:hypothetical protein
MLTDLDIFWQKEWDVFEHTEHDRTQYAVYAIILDNQIVDIRKYNKLFIDLFNTYKFVETGFTDEKYTIDVFTEDSVLVITLELSKDLGALFLSNPTTVLVTGETAYASSDMVYVNGMIIRA